MADYRLSAQIISRAKGQSSIASAAYRAAVRMDDPRTGEVHDFTRKQGVTFSAVLAPEDAPDWMRDRGQLWRAVEAAEKRKDAQLAREVQLSLPHELNPEQRRALLVGFVQEQFVARGMVADIAVHEPGRDGDNRNHHAHVMLTMRSLTGDGFGNKVRDWNDPSTLQQWREAWAHHQNRELERHGHAARVDHRSFEAQGVDREPQQHMGPTAADMERKGKASRIGDENRARSFNNAARADRYRQHYSIEEQRQRFEIWAKRQAGAIRSGTERRLDADSRSMEARHTTQRDRLEARIRQQYGTHKATIGREVQAVDRRLQAGGVRRIFRDLLGRTRSDERARQDLARSLRSIEQREADHRTLLQHRQRQEADDLRRRAAEAERKRLDGIERARKEREATGWQPNPPVTAPQKPAQEAFRAAALSDGPKAETPSRAKSGPEAAEKSADSRPSRSGRDRPWSSNELEQRRPWEGGLTRGRGSKRERRPDGDDPKPTKD